MSEQLAKSLIGKTPWGVELGLNSMLTLEFGAPDQRRSSRATHGEWHLWLYCCFWRIEGERQIVTGSGDSPKLIHETLQTIHWTEIVDVQMHGYFHELEIHFRDGTILRTFAACSGRPDVDQWLLYAPSLKVLISRGTELLVKDSTLAT